MKSEKQLLLLMTVKNINAPDGIVLTDGVQFTYSIKDGLLTIDGDNIHVVAKAGQIDNIKMLGDNCIIELGDGNDIIDMYGENNTVDAGEGDDKIKVYGNAYTLRGGEGDDEFEVKAINSDITDVSGDDKLTITGGSSNKYSGIEKVDLNPDSGVVILTPNAQKGLIKYTDSDEKEMVFEVTPNLPNAREKLAGTIYVDYEIKDIEVEINGKVVSKKQLVVNGTNIALLSKNGNESVYAKVIGNNNQIDTLDADDFIEIEGTGNNVIAREGQNNVKVVGTYNEVVTGRSIDTIDVKGDNNKIVGGGEKDKVTFAGLYNSFSVTEDGGRKGGSLALTKEIGPQTIVIGNRAYEVSIFNVDEAELENKTINVTYMIEKIDGSDYMVFRADNIKIRVIDNRITYTTDENTTDNKDSLKLIGNNCYVFGGSGSDVIRVEGDNNILDGWYGNDSFDVKGNNNEIRGFEGDDRIILDGDNNTALGEDGNDSITVNGGDGNSYSGVEKFIK